MITKNPAHPMLQNTSSAPLLPVHRLLPRPSPQPQKQRSHAAGPARLLIATLMIGGGSAPAADYVWTGAKDNDWHTPGNWNPGGVPGKADHAVISNITTDTSINLSCETAIGNLTFDPQAPHACVITGQALLLGEGAQVIFKRLSKVGAKGSQAIACPIQIAGRVRFRNDNRWYLGAESLTLSGQIRGTGEIVISGVAEGTVSVTGANTGYAGAVTIESGSLLMGNNEALGSGTDPVRVLGGQLNLGSKVSCKRAFLYAADARWTGQPDCNVEGTVTVNSGITWQITNGGGCPTKLTAIVQGEGNVNFATHGARIAGATANTLSGKHTFGGDRGPTRLAKPKGVTAVAGPVVMSAMGTLCWESDDQIDDQVPVIFAGSNPLLQLQGHRETVGALDLQSNGTIDLGTADARLVFADSSAKTWKPNCALLIRNGGKDCGTLQFSTNGNGLTAAQLAQVGFHNPAGCRPGTYTATLRSNGELAPTDQRVPPVDLPIDMSAAAYEARRASYDVTGLTSLGGPATPLKKGMVISVFGDSITWGGGLVPTLQKGISEGQGSAKLQVHVINHGVNGAGVQTLRDGQDSKNHAGGKKPEPFAQTIAADQSTLAVIFIGVNDVWWKKSTPEEFEKMLGELVAQARANKTIPVLATLAMLKDSPLKPNPTCDLYAEITRKVARDTHTVLVDLRKAFMACLSNEGLTVYPNGSWECNDKLLNHDGVHTTGRGDKLIADMMAQGILEALNNNNP